ncbi:hypothetical protein Pst134EA_013429 [Puccinia striiformis f. sp. tritici]|uniref:hypothetical protein n=1 Tax=Puccinia striiformis f. sp. tritici TaxID=168172 RepID=UPI00200837C9|nr:hypothetical protein Pst134EA_013429 [Puccinia striiformis f. sp. tritici]KAH9454309.1 hypothetical protein Pst134EB_014402 [Puccinia striiformis f. sp. tritici]KAH9465548.1 hypothetical protein Pst134EA_013429 [Puccinia striiformis f. sp. tritici]
MGSRCRTNGFWFGEISKAFDCQIQVNDNDGESLLIEAADNLPKWVTPHLAKGRSEGHVLKLLGHAGPRPHWTGSSDFDC